jgi:4-amino-4-deoxy-L-arabinose transferase-like glycosyltransferase
MTDAVIAAAIGASLRAAVVLWAAPRFPPAEDGHFYHIVAGRMAAGQGYTWLWPDGSVTFAAHYPVGYPAVLAGLYALLGGPVAPAAMLFNAVLGSVAVFAVHRVVASGGSRLSALLASLAVAVHPGLVMYTPALMTEGVTAALLAMSAWCAVATRSARSKEQWKWLFGLGVLMGVTALVRPESLLLAPVFGALAASGSEPGTGEPRPRWCRLRASAWVFGIALGTCSPWTVRNCLRMDRCVLLSANGGWNLYIGSMPEGNGGWVPIEGESVPPACRRVFGEANKDICFARAARERILAHSLSWLRLIPQKLAATFDYSGASAFYLQASNPRELGAEAKLRLGLLETGADRMLVLAALLAVLRLDGPQRQWRSLVCAASLPWLFLRWAWLSWLGVVFGAALLGRRMNQRLAVPFAASVIALTALVHAVFFGAGRYSLVCIPLLAALAALVVEPRDKLDDRSARNPTAAQRLPRVV